jgi:hypothetical protein
LGEMISTHMSFLIKSIHQWAAVVATTDPPLLLAVRACPSTFRLIFFGKWRTTITHCVLLRVTATACTGTA